MHEQHNTIAAEDPNLGNQFLFDLSSKAKV